VGATEKADPFGGRGKENYVRDVFDAIARPYDRMNLIITAGVFRRWERFFVQSLGVRPGMRVLDVACGTGELSFAVARLLGDRGEVVGLDLSQGMLAVAREKAGRRPEGRRVQFVEGNALHMPFADGEFDLVMSGFALRNFADLSQAIKEMVRVTRPGGRVTTLELTQPVNPFLALPYKFYFFHVVPWVGRVAERTWGKPGGITPYAWLATSLKGFPGAPALAELMQAGGLTNVGFRYLTGGIVAVHWGEKAKAGDEA